jgi:hypothetical protein
MWREPAEPPNSPTYPPRNNREIRRVEKMCEFPGKTARIVGMPPVHGVRHDVRMRIASPPRTDVLPSFKLGEAPTCAGKRTILNWKWQLKWK